MGGGGWEEHDFLFQIKNICGCCGYCAEMKCVLFCTKGSCWVHLVSSLGAGWAAKPLSLCRSCLPKALRAPGPVYPACPQLVGNDFSDMDNQAHGTLPFWPRLLQFSVSAHMKSHRLDTTLPPPAVTEASRGADHCREAQAHSAHEVRCLPFRMCHVAEVDWSSLDSGTA